MFDNPQVQNEIEAYLLGLLYADGSILHKNTNPNIYNTIRIGLTSRDEDNLFRFNKYLNWNTCKSKSYIGNKSYDITYIANYSISFTKKMINLGIVPRKTYSNDDFVFTNVPNNLKRHFIRGYFDGNGCVMINKHNQMTFELCSNNAKFLNTLLKYFKNFINTKSNVTLGDGVYRIRIGGNHLCYQIFHLMYDCHNLDLHLDRKYEKFKKIDDIINYPKQNYKGENLK